MALPEPTPGLVIAYAYLWLDEARQGQAEGQKDRPCVIVLSVQRSEGHTVVSVAPVTHSAPTDPTQAVELPQAVKARLGLDQERSWVVISELNRFLWPGFDLRPVRRGSSDYAYGLLPRSFFIHLRDRLMTLARARRVSQTRRDG